MNTGKQEQIQYFLERLREGELSKAEVTDLTNLLYPFRVDVDVLGQLAKESLDLARRACALVESQMFYLDAEQLRQELYLLEDEHEAARLGATTGEAEFQAHVTLFSLLPVGVDATERRRRVLALALTVNHPEQAGRFVGDHKPGYEQVTFWGPLRKRLFHALRERAPELAIALIDWPEDAWSWLMHLLSDPDTDSELVRKLTAHIQANDLPTILPLPETLRLITLLGMSEHGARAYLLCRLAEAVNRPVEDRPALLEHLMDVGKTLPEAERTQLADAIRRSGVVYLSLEQRRNVLRRLAHFSRHCHPEIRRELRILRAMTLLIHIHPRRLEQAEKWASAYGRRFQKRLQAVLSEREQLLVRAAALLRKQSNL